jgi:hypothetical protein
LLFPLRDKPVPHITLFQGPAKPVDRMGRRLAPQPFRPVVPFRSNMPGVSFISPRRQARQEYPFCFAILAALREMLFFVLFRVARKDFDRMNRIGRMKNQFVAGNPRSLFSLLSIKHEYSRKESSPET